MPRRRRRKKCDASTSCRIILASVVNASRRRRRGLVARLWSQGGHRRSGGRKSPSGIQGRSPGVSLEAKPQKPDIYKQYLQLSNVFLHRFVAESYPRFCANPMTQRDRGRMGTHVPTHGYATAIKWVVWLWRDVLSALEIFWECAI